MIPQETHDFLSHLPSLVDLFLLNRGIKIVFYKRESLEGRQIWGLQDQEVLSHGKVAILLLKVKAEREE